jgi:hypothetical protein
VTGHAAIRSRPVQPWPSRPCQVVTQASLPSGSARTRTPEPPRRTSGCRPPPPRPRYAPAPRRAVPIRRSGCGCAAGAARPSAGTRPPGPGRAGRPADLADRSCRARRRSRAPPSRTARMAAMSSASMPISITCTDRVCELPAPLFVVSLNSPATSEIRCASSHVERCHPADLRGLQRQRRPVGAYVHPQVPVRVGHRRRPRGHVGGQRERSGQHLRAELAQDVAPPDAAERVRGLRSVSTPMAEFWNPTGFGASLDTLAPLSFWFPFTASPLPGLPYRGQGGDLGAGWRVCLRRNASSTGAGQSGGHDGHLAGVLAVSTVSPGP